MRRGETRFGIIWLLSGTLLVLGALLVLARYPGIFRTGTEYHAVFKSVAGLNKGDEVRYGGLPVGTGCSSPRRRVRGRASRRSTVPSLASTRQALGSRG